MMDIKQALSLFITTCFICTRAVYSQRPEQLSVVHISGNIVVTWQPPNSRNRVKYFKILITYPNGRRIEVNATETRYMLPVYNADGHGKYSFSVLAYFDPSGSSHWSSTESITITPGTIEPMPVAKISDPFHFDEPAVGKDHTLRCTVANSNVVNRSYRYRWKINNEIIETSKDRYSVYSSGLTIRMVTKQDKNMSIQCQVESGSRRSNFSTVVLLNPRYGPTNVTIIPMQQSMTIDENKRLSLSCLSDCYPSCRYQWYHKPRESNNFKIYTFAQNLSIRNVKKRHAGNFRCTVTSPDNDLIDITQSRYIQLSVNYGPEPESVVILSNSPLEVIENKVYTGGINCKADCYPECSLKWRFKPKGSRSYRDLKRGGVLNISTFKRNNTGVYRCKARNTVLNNRNEYSDLQIVVHYGPANVSITPSRETTSLRERTYFKGIKCSAECGNDCTYKWTKNASPLRRSSPRILRKRLSETDAGKYKCRVINNISRKTAQSSIFKLDILYGPKNIRILSADNRTIQWILRKSRGSRIGKLSCYADCNPACNYTWESVNRHFQHIGQSLDLGAATLDKNGTYSCTAQNIYGNRSIEITLNIEEYGIKVFNSSEFITSPFYVVEGSPLYLVCYAKCSFHYQCSYRWEIHNRQLSQRAVFTKAVRKYFSGVYVCYDDYENKKESLYVIVQYKPTIRYIRLNNYYTTSRNQFEIKMRNDMELECKVDSLPRANVTLKRLEDENILTTNLNTNVSLYVKKETDCEDSGTYICEADNGIGDVVRSNISVNVRCPPYRLSRIRSMKKNNFSRKVDSNVMFIAVARGYPPVEAKWFYKYNATSTKSEIPVPEQNISNADDVFSFYIDKITEEDYGLYELELSNEEGNLTFQFYLEPEAIVKSSDNLGSGGRNRSSLGSFIGAVVAGIAFLCLIVIVLVVILMKKRNRSKKEIPPEPEGFSRDSSGQFDQDEDNYSQISKVKARKQTENTSASNAYDNTTYLLDSNGNTNTDQPQECNVEFHKRNSYTYAQVQKRKTGDSKETEEFQVLPVGDEKVSGNDNNVYAKVVKKPAQENGKAGGHEKEKTTIKRQRAGGKRKKSSAAKQKSKTEEAMNYVELDLQSQSSEAGGTAKFVIHGVENKTTYSLVDFTKHADPLPENENSDILQGSEEQNLEEQSGEQTLDSTENDNKC